jgi:hypothetical protein
MTGILLIILFGAWGDFGLIGLLLFFIALILTQKKEPDEREIFLTYKIGSLEGIVIGTAMAIIYFKFPDINWFYALITIALISRGIIGYVTFKFD